MHRTHQRFAFFCRENKSSPSAAEQILEINAGLSKHVAMVSSASSSDSDNFTIRNVQLHLHDKKKAAVSLRCLVQNVPVDISINGVKSMLEVELFQRANKLIGKNQLFKKSQVLIKAWCGSEACRYTGGIPIMGGSGGTLSTYAISIMVLSLFVDDPALTSSLISPYQVLKRFLTFWGSFDWKNGVVRLNPTPDNDIGEGEAGRGSVLYTCNQQHHDDCSGSSAYARERNCSNLAPSPTPPRPCAASRPNVICGSLEISTDGAG